MICFCVVPCVLPSAIMTQSRIVLALDHLRILRHSLLVDGFLLAWGSFWSTSWAYKQSSTLRHLDASTLSKSVLLLACLAKCNSEKSRWLVFHSVSIFILTIFTWLIGLLYNLNSVWAAMNLGSFFIVSGVVDCLLILLNARIGSNT